MIRKMITGSILAAALMPVAAFAASGPYQFWLSEEDGAKTYAVMNVETELATTARVDAGEAVISSGEDAREIIAALDGKMPKTSVINLEDGSNIRITADGETRSEIIIMESDEAGTVNVDEILKEHDIEWTEEGGEKTVIIRKEVRREGGADSMDIDVLADGEEVELTDEGAERRRIVIRKSGEPDGEEVVINVERDASIEADVEKEVRILTDDRKGTGENSFAYSFSASEEGTSRQRFIHITGADAEAAAEFIDGLDSLSVSERAEMKAALEL